MIKVSLFADANCSSCQSAEQELRKLSDRRRDIELVFLRRPQGEDKFREFDVVICPDVFVENKFVSYGPPDIRTIESLLENSGASLKTKEHLKTKIKGDLK